MVSKETCKFIGLFEIICFIIVIVSLTSVFLLSIKKFNVVLAIGLSAVLILISAKRYYRFISIKIISKSNLALLFILLLALVFRYSPYLHVIGNWDPGTYVLMSESYGTTGSPLVYDDVRARITDQSLLKIYDDNNYRSIFPIGERKKGLAEGYRNAGIWVLDLDHGNYAFQYYPVHPLWMSIFAHFFGSENRVYSLVLFSLISITAIFLIAYELTGSLTPAIIAGVLLALNPIHVFYSKEPTSEVVSLAFILCSIYFLLKYFDSNKEKYSNLYLVLSAGLMGCLFFTHIHGFSFLPLFYLLSLLFLLGNESRVHKKQILVYVAAIWILYGLSVVYGYFYMYHYFIGILAPSLNFILLKPDVWSLSVAAVFLFFIALVLFFVQTRKWKSFDKLINMMQENKRLLLCISFLGIMTFAFYKVIFVVIPGGMAYNIILFIKLISLPVFVLAFPAICLFSKRGMRFFSFCIFIIFFSFLTLSFYSEPIYDFMRYYLPEMIPGYILLSSILLSDMLKSSKWLKILAWAVLVFVAADFTYYSFHQFQGHSMEGATESLEQIVKQMHEGDLLIMDRNEGSFWDMKSTFEYYYNIKVFGAREVMNLTNSELLNISRPYNNTMVLAFKELNQTTDSKFELVSKILYRQGDFSKRWNSDGIIIPFYYGINEEWLWLYKFDKNSTRT
jgi:hypothetical protein